jgi:HEAT repeat protein
VFNKAEGRESRLAKKGRKDTMKTVPHKLLRVLPDKDWWGRQRMISDLIAHPEEEYIGHLEEGLRNNDDANVRNTMMEVYRALGRRALPSLAVLARDADTEVRLFAVNILSDIGDEQGLPVLLSTIRDGDINVRAASAEALGRIGGSRALAALNEALCDETWVAMAAVHAMGEIGGQEALDILYECMDRREYRDIALAAVERAGDAGSIQHLTKYFERSDVRDRVLKAIVKIGERERVRPAPEYFFSIVPVLVGMIESSPPDIKRYAVIALCWSHDIMGLPYMIEAVRDEELQEYAIEGLLGIGRRTVCAVVDELKASSGSHRPVLAKVLDMIGEGKALLQFAEDEDPEVRTEVALALGSLDLERAVLALERMLSDPHDEVRKAACKSFGKVHEDGFLL